MALKRTAQRFRYTLTRKVVLGRAQAAHEDDNVCARERDARRTYEIRAAIAHDGLEAYFHAKPVKLGGEKKRICVLAEGC
jgi:hypothetical protein